MDTLEQSLCCGMDGAAIDNGRLAYRIAFITAVNAPGSQLTR